MIEEKEDFFEDTPEEKPKKVKPPKQPKYKPDDPRYYEKEESKWEHLKPSPYHRTPLIWITGGIVVLLIILVSLYSYLFSPQVQDAVEYGYVENVQREGKVFETYEGVIIPYKLIKDTLRAYEGDFVFSTRDEHIAAELRRHQASGNPVMVKYKVYRSRLPWRGNSKIIVTGVDTVNASVILPPDRRPEHP